MSTAEQVAKFPHWYHCITLPDGSVTPGINNSQGTLAVYDSLGLPSRLDGLRVLDIGCSDGFYAFTAEARGAREVIGLDFRLPTANGFAIASAILGSNVQYEVDNVYNISSERYGAFDLIFFVGVIYHLRNPLLALDKVRSVARPGALVLVESHIMNADLGADLKAAGCSDAAIAQTLALPLWHFHLRDSLNHDLTNRWAPTLAGIEQMCEQALLKPVASHAFGTRGAVLCRAFNEPELEYRLALDSQVGVNSA